MYSIAISTVLALLLLCCAAVCCAGAVASPPDPALSSPGDFDPLVLLLPVPLTVGDGCGGSNDAISCKARLILFLLPCSAIL